jgi:hypothetical protein
MTDQFLPPGWFAVGDLARPRLMLADVPSGGILGSFPQQQDPGDQANLPPFDRSSGWGRGILAPLERINVGSDQHVPARPQTAVPFAVKAAAQANEPRLSRSTDEGPVYSGLPPPSGLPLRDSSAQLAQWWAPMPLLFARPPVIIPRQLTPLEELPPGSSGGAGAGRAFPRSRGAEEPEGTPCIYCKQPTTKKPGSSPNRFHREHIIPRSKGGNDSPENYGPACQTCNLKKGPRTPEEWYESLQSGDVL